MKTLPSWLISISLHALLIGLAILILPMKQVYQEARPLPVYEAYISFGGSVGRGDASDSPQFPQSSLQEDIEEILTFSEAELPIDQPQENGNQAHSTDSSDFTIESSIGTDSIAKLPKGKNGLHFNSSSKAKTPSADNTSGSGSIGTGGIGASTTRVALGGVNPPPPYPEVARRNGWEGLVVLSVKVSPDGRAEEVVVKESSGYEILDKSARDTVAKWLFQPAKMDGVATEGFVEVPIRFKLR